MSKYKPYPKYKESGVAWLGEVPEGWEVKAGKFIGKILTTPSINDKDLNENGSFFYIKVNDLNYINGIYLNSSKHKISNNLNIKSINNYICFPKRGAAIFTNKACIVKVKSLIDPNLMAWKIFDKYNDKFFLQTLLTRGLAEIADVSTVPQINNKHIEPIKFPVPPIEEQNRIIDYIENKTKKIDTLIKKQQTLLELLKEKRQALISHVVTKGLDDSVAMKSSGVAWLGDVPEGWEIGLLSSLFLNNKEKNIGMKNNNLLSLSYGRIIQKNIDTSKGLLPANFESYQIVKKGFIVLRLTDLQNDKKSLRVGFVNEKGIITSAYVGLAKKSQSIGNEKYFYYFLHSFDIHKGFYGMGAGVRQGLNFNELKKLKFTLPPLKEQNKIVDYIDQKTKQIDTLIKKSTKAIELLKERRVALVSAVVTGKVDVQCQ